MYKRFIVAAACLIFFSPTSLPAASGGDPAAWGVNDLTGALELSAVDESGPMLTVSLKNKSAEVITAVALAFRADAHYYQDWLNADPSGLVPGHTFELSVGTEEGSARKITISAVIFEDGSGKGDPVQLDLMNCHRFGQILESARIKGILRNRNSSNDDSSLNALTQKIGKLPLSVEDAFVSLAGISLPGIQLNSLRQSGEKSRNALLGGVSATRERVLRQIENVKLLPVLSPDANVPTRAAVLSVLQEQYETQNKKAFALLTRMQGGR